MVCPCCIRVVRMDMENIGVEVVRIQLGRMMLRYNVEETSLSAIKKILSDSGFPLVESKEKILIEQIKKAVIEMVQYSLNNNITRNSDYLVDKLGYSYQHLSSLFSKHEKVTLERYIILNKIEKVKELISQEELSLSEIAFMLGYSSVQYLSTQFKLITGMSVTEYKNAGTYERVGLNNLY